MYSGRKRVRYPLSSSTVLQLYRPQASWTTQQYLLSNRRPFFARRLLREKVKQTRMPFSGPICYDDRCWLKYALRGQRDRSWGLSDDFEQDDGLAIIQRARRKTGSATCAPSSCPRPNNTATG